MTEAKGEPTAPPAPTPEPAPLPEETGFDMTSVKEVSSLSITGLLIGGGALALLFLVLLFNSPSEPEATAAEATAEVATEAADEAAEAAEPAVEAAEGDAAAPAAEEAADAAAAWAARISMDFPQLLDACKAADTPVAADQCNELGNKYQEGVEVTKDSPLAASIYFAGCYQGSMMACSNAGMLFAGIEGVPPDPDLSFQLLKRACGAQIMHGCAELGYNYENGIGTARNAVQARQLYDYACTNGLKAGCDYRNRLDSFGN